MQKIKMSRGTLLTFEEGCNKYLENCRQRNLREGTIGHYRQSYTQFFEYFDLNMAVSDITKEYYDNCVLHLRKTLDNDVGRKGQNTIYSIKSVKGIKRESRSSPLRKTNIIIFRFYQSKQPLSRERFSSNKSFLKFPSTRRQFLQILCS